MNIDLKVRTIKGCNICGSKLVFIRGRYPNMKKRKICSTCAYERLENIHDISDSTYNQAYKDE